MASLCRVEGQATTVDLGLGPEPPVIFLRGPWPLITEIVAITEVTQRDTLSGNRSCLADPSTLLLMVVAFLRLQ